MPFALAYAIARHQFLGIRVVVQPTLLYGLMTAVFASCYATFIYALERAGLDPHNTNPLVWVIFFAIIAVTFASIRDGLRLLVDRVVYRTRYQRARLLHDLGARLASVQDLDEVLAIVASNLVDAMNVAAVAVLLREPDGTFTLHAMAGDFSHSVDRQALLDGAAQRARGPDNGLWIPLIAHDEECGVLYLRPRRVPGKLTPDDLTLVETLAHQTAVAVANVVLVRRLRAKVAEMELLRDRLLHVQDEERKRLAQELHDGALHAVWALVRQAVGAASDPSSGDIDRSSPLHALAELGQDIAYQLRQTCSRLYPCELNHLGLSAALLKLVETTSIDEDITLRFSALGAEDRQLPEEVQEVLYRVAREAVNNLVQHSQATVAHITLQVAPPAVTLSIRDNGQGFTVPPTGSLVRRGHLGLVGMRERVERLGGDFKVTSIPGHGTEVFVYLDLPGREGVLWHKTQHAEVSTICESSSPTITPSPERVYGNSSPPRRISR